MQSFLGTNYVSGTGNAKFLGHILCLGREGTQSFSRDSLCLGVHAFSWGTFYVLGTGDAKFLGGHFMSRRTQIFLGDREHNVSRGHFNFNGKQCFSVCLVFLQLFFRVNALQTCKLYVYTVIAIIIAVIIHTIMTVWTRFKAIRTGRGVK